MESSIYSIFQVDIKNLVQNKFLLCKNCQIGYDVIETLPYWEYEELIDIANKHSEEEAKQQEEEKGKYDVGSMTRQAAGSMPRINLSNPKLPKI